MDITRVNARVQYGRGRAAQVVGQLYDVYRLTNQTGSMVQGAPLITSLPVHMTRWKESKDLEGIFFENLLFAGVYDNTQTANNVQPGDMLVGKGYEYDATNYCVVGERPLKQNVLARCEQNATLSFPHAPGSIDSMPGSGSIAVTGTYGAQTKATEQILVLTNGLYSFANSGTPATVPIGIQPISHLREPHPPDLPTSIRRQYFNAFVPALPGVQLLETTVINAANGDRYRIEQPYYNPNNLVGYICIVQKLNV